MKKRIVAVFAAISRSGSFPGGVILEERALLAEKEARTMKGSVSSIRKPAPEERLTEAYEVRAFRDESEAVRESASFTFEIRHAEPGEIQTIKKTASGHGEQTVLPDDCQFGDNDLCSVES